VLSQIQTLKIKTQIRKKTTNITKKQTKNKPKQLKKQKQKQKTTHIPQNVYDKIPFLIITDQIRTSKKLTITQITT
jgi:hypothetical protein